ncbi:MAG TPA: hypothetical protein V6D20_04320 [Candidatus Obscuribacterales bacterium]
MNDDSEILLKMIEREEALVRHYEDQRATVTNFVLVATSLVIGFLTQKGVVLASLPAALLLVLLGVYGAITVTKLYERTQFASAFIKQYINQINERYPQLLLTQIKDKVRTEHKAKFPRSSMLHMHQLWSLLHIIIAFLGCCLVVAILIS